MLLSTMLALPLPGVCPACWTAQIALIASSLAKGKVALIALGAKAAVMGKALAAIKMAAMAKLLAVGAGAATVAYKDKIKKVLTDEKAPSLPVASINSTMPPSATNLTEIPSFPVPVNSSVAQVTASTSESNVRSTVQSTSKDPSVVASVVSAEHL